MSHETMRFYIHHESEPEFTLAISWSLTDRRTVRVLSQHFAAAFARAFPHHAPTNFTLAADSELSSSACVCSCVNHAADLIATLAPVDTAATAPITAAAVPPAPSAAGSSSSAALDATLKPYLEAADKAWKARYYAKAKAIYTELLNVVPTLGVALSRLGEIEAQAGRHDDACLLLERALRVDPASVPAAIALAKAQLASGDAAEAAGVLKAAMDRWEGKKSAAAAAKARTLKIELGRTLFAGGARQEGGQLLTEILSQDVEEQDALEAYGEACVALGQHDDALKIFLRMITTRSEDKHVRRMLATSIGSAGGVELLRSQLPFDAKSASALAFLATIVKDFSHLDAACALYDEAARLVPTSASYALNYAHTLEVSGRYADALGVISAHLCANPSRTCAGIAASQVAALLPTRQDFEAARWRPPSEAPSAAAAAAAAEPSTAALAGAGGPLGPAEGKRSAKLAPPDELDQLALCFTAVKILFVQGLLAAAGELVALLEPGRRTLADLHLTLIRNENAYYCCAAMLMASLPRELPALAPLYVLGDSHSLSPAWRTVHWGDTPRLLVPALVTGLKAWHLRDGSDFFPKANFESVVKSLPDGADVIVAFGEIDCREGLLLAVERARYANLDEAISTVVGIYVTVLRKLAAKRRFRIMVHPVPPVLNETRAVVVQFNAALQRAVEAAAPTLAWLDFFGALLAPSGEALAEGMALDGTHLSPDYLRHLEAALPG